MSQRPFCGAKRREIRREMLMGNTAPAALQLLGLAAAAAAIFLDGQGAVWLLCGPAIFV